MWREYKSTKKQPLYSVWCGMKARCHNSNVDSYKDYGGRGIKICADWQDFTVFSAWAFLNGYDKGMTLERIDVNGDYCPENCCFASMKEQQRNRRNNVFIEIDGSKYLSTDLAEMLGLPTSTISRWIKQGVLFHKLIFGEDPTRTKAKETISARA